MCSSGLLLYSFKSCLNELTTAAFGIVSWSRLLFIVVHTHSDFFTALPVTEAMMISRVPAADERQACLLDTLLFG